jgi:GNAT superfamily N-acetyltransferase
MITLRQAQPGDEAVVLGLANELADFPVPPWRTADEIRRADHPILRAVVARTPSDQLMLIADEDGVALGCVYVVTNRDYFTGEALAYVEVLAVAAAARGRGIGRQLMEAAEEWARVQGYHRIRLAVWTQNEPARGLYEHLGYRPETVYYLKAL